MSPQISPFAFVVVTFSWAAGSFLILLTSDNECHAAKPRLLFVQTIGEKESGKPRQLVGDTDYTQQGSPDWSADGKMIAFDAWRETESFSGAHIFVVNADGSDLRNLGPGAMPNFSPVGKRIVFSGVQIMNVDGTGRESLGSGWGAQWSPDGKSIAFGSNNNIVVMNLETKEQRSILEGEHAGRYRSVYWNLGWSRDSKYVCFKGLRGDGEHEVPIVDVAGSSKGFQVLVKQATNADFSWHPDGKRILLSMRDPMRKIQRLYLVDRENPEAPKPVRGQRGGCNNLDADWSPDGKQIVYSSQNIMGQ